MGKDFYWWIARHEYLSMSQDVCQEEATLRGQKCHFHWIYFATKYIKSHYGVHSLYAEGSTLPQYFFAIGIFASDWFSTYL